jgi:hypothetical protein
MTAVVLAVLLFACTTPEPIQVRITPTPNATITVATAVPTSTPPETTLEAPILTLTPYAPDTSPTSEVTVEVAAALPDATIRGPLVSTDYQLPTLPPVIIDIPTITNTPPGPTPGPTDTPGPSPTPYPTLDGDRIGLQLDSNLDFESWERLIADRAVPTGVGWIKIQVNWAFLQPDGPDDWNPQMQLFERQIEQAARPGFNILLSIAKAPSWTRTDLTEDGPPDDPQELADFIAFMLGTKIGPVTSAIEVWNEPNLIREWRGTLPHNGAGYMTLFRPAYDAIRAYSPDITIVTAGLAPTSTFEGAVDDRDFLRQMYQAGLSSYTDVVIGIHPYGWGNPPDARCCGEPDEEPGWDEDPHFFFYENIEEMRQIMNENGHQTVPLWITEFGWATWDGMPNEAPELWMTYNTAQEQANYTVRALEIGLQERDDIGVMILWNLNFANPFIVEQRSEIAGYSLLNPAIFPQERPLYNALAVVTGGPEGE